jgi:membrane peptidoglycan carboxypeptidase
MLHPTPHRHDHTSPLLAWLGTLGAAALAVALTLLLALGFMVTAVGNAAGQAMDIVMAPINGEARLGDLEERSVILAADGSVLAIMHDEYDREPVPLDAVPEHVRHAVIAAEDRRFFEHEGYDAGGIGRAIIANFRAGEVAQGGSTITQQLAKLNFVGADRTFQRKLDELLYAVELEERFTKEELLQRYLNQVYFGGGAYGVAAAAEEFFRVEPGELRPEQGALLAGVIRAPAGLDPRRIPTGRSTGGTRSLPPWPPRGT